MKSVNQIVIFTDLDGTLLDEDTYSPAPASKALNLLQKNQVKIIFCSSKTRKEQEILRTSLNINDLFIVENGSAIIIPPDSEFMTTTDTLKEENGTRIVILGKTSDQIQILLDEIRIETGLKFQAFHTLSTEQVAQITGLDIKLANLAQRRDYSATIVTKFNQHELRIFSKACDNRNLNCAQGGRFLGITGKGADKGKAVEIVKAAYRSQYNKVTTIGIGDSPNDAPMLSAVDYPYLVQRPNGKWRHLDISNPIYLPAIGPFGFAAMIDDLVHKGYLS